VSSTSGGLATRLPSLRSQQAPSLFYAACMPASQHGLLVPEGSAIRSLVEIKGEKVAFARGSSAQNVILRLLAKAALTYGDIEPVYLPPPDASAALSRGSVDAWVIWDPLFAQRNIARRCA
jgi:sulfonate transport system substrate-binding protein